MPLFSNLAKLVRGNTYKKNLLKIPRTKDIYGSVRYPSNYYVTPPKKNKKTRKLQQRVEKPLTQENELEAIRRSPNYMGNLRTFTNVSAIARRKEEEERKKMLGSLYRPNLPSKPFTPSYRYTPVVQKKQGLTEEEKQRIERNLLKALDENNTNFNNNGSIVTGDPNQGSRPSSPYGGKRTRKAHRSTKRRRYTKKH